MRLLLPLLILFSLNSFALSLPPIQTKDFSRQNIENIYTGRKQIILSFDDGPNPVTSKFLDLLDEYNIKANFFVIGKNVQNHPELIQRIVNDGHVVGNHSMTHTPLKNLDPLLWRNKVKSEVLDAHEVLLPYMTNNKHFYFRAPEAAWANKYADYLNESEIGKEYIGPILWDIGGEIEIKNGKFVQAADWECWAKKISVEDCLSGYLYEIRQKKGGVVLMHDLTSKSHLLLRKLIPILEDEGYSFVTLNEVEWKTNR